MTEERTVRNLVLTVCDLKQQGDVPTARVAAQLVTVGTKIYLHGGADDKQGYGDLHLMEIEKASWREMPVGGFSKPSPRYAHSLNLHDRNLILFGGLAHSPDKEIMLDESMPTSYAPPPFMSGGRPWQHQGTPSHDLFILQTDGQLTWTEADTSGGPRPSARSMHAASVCKAYLVIFGGATDAQLTQTTNDLFVLNLTSMEWLKTEQLGEIPSARCGHKTAYVPASDNILMFGGADDDGTVFSLSCASIPNLTWSRVEISNTPPFARTFHSLDLIGDRLFVFAGSTLAGDGAADLYLYQLNKGKWSRPLFDGQINVRGHASAVLHDKLIVFGGSRERSDQQRDKLDEDGLSTGQHRVSKKMFFLNVLEIREGAGDGDFKFKLVTVGDSGVGKSCLLTRFVQDVYSDFHVSTIGLDFKSVVTMLKGKLVTLQLWDTAGQERFSGVTGNYYRNADGFVLVFDATRRESFEHIENWMKQIEEHHDCGSSSTVLLIVGNKRDLKSEVTVTEAEAKALADKMGALYVATSAKTATNVDAAFLSAANQLVEIRRKAAVASRKSTLGGQSIEGRVTLGGGGGGDGGGGGGGGCGGGGCGGGGGGGATREVDNDARTSSGGRRRW
eukprot:GHVS01005675.1.p1 GENE.GHVS01005675.1~~GHVS01005675.1.p1  ORF type:complete len:617 (+),score=131.99 GHVS01005675.1:66-1916(+)